MPIKLPVYDLDALLGVSGTKVVSTTEEVSDTNVVSTTPVVNTTETISDTKAISSTKVSDTKSTPVISDTKISSTKSVSVTNGQKMNAWKKANRDTIRLEVPKGEKARLKAEAARRGLSVTGLVKAAVAEYLEGHPAEEEEG